MEVYGAGFRGTQGPKPFTAAGLAPNRRLVNARTKVLRAIRRNLAPGADARWNQRIARTPSRRVEEIGRRSPPALRTPDKSGNGWNRCWTSSSAKNRPVPKALDQARCPGEAEDHSAPWPSLISGSAFPDARGR